jgi:hypothetical protein
MEDAPARPLAQALEFDAADGSSTSGPTWRFQLLLWAIGAATHDGSDLTYLDRHILTRIDRYLAAYATAHGDEAADQALITVIEVLQKDAERPSRH